MENSCLCGKVYLMEVSEIWVLKHHIAYLNSRCCWCLDTDLFHHLYNLEKMRSCNKNESWVYGTRYNFCKTNTSLEQNCHFRFLIHTYQFILGNRHFRVFWYFFIKYKSKLPDSLKKKSGHIVVYLYMYICHPYHHRNGKRDAYVTFICHLCMQFSSEISNFLLFQMLKEKNMTKLCSSCKISHLFCKLDKFNFLYSIYKSTTTGDIKPFCTILLYDIFS